RERAALGILAGEAHRMTFQQQRAERQRLGRRPVDALPGLDRLGARIEEALDGAANVEALRRRGDLPADALERLGPNPGVAPPRIVAGARDLHAGPAAVEPVGAVRPVALARLELCVEPGAPVGPHLLDLALGDDILADQSFGVDGERARVRTDR